MNKQLNGTPSTKYYTRQTYCDFFSLNLDNLREFLAFVNNGWEWFSGLVQAEGSYYNEINFLNSCGHAYDEITFRKEPET